MKRLFWLFTVYGMSGLELNAQTVTDFNGNTYATVVIHEQEWMAVNLKTTHYRNGDLITHVTSNQTWASGATGAYCYYNNEVANATTYGALYNWFAVSDIRGLCPDGWKVPDKDEWQKLIDNLGGNSVAGSRLKTTGTGFWKTPNEGATNESGFSGLPGGMRLYNGTTFWEMGDYGTWWTSSDYSETGANNRFLSYNNTGVGWGDGTKQNGYTVRCMKKIASGINTETINSLKSLIFPNPVSGSFFIMSENYSYSGVTIYDLLGKNVMQKQITQNISEIDISSWPDGIYIVSIHSETGIINYKLIKR